MKLLPTQIDETSLTAFGEEARALLVRHDYAVLASRFGYALAYDRPPAAALEVDFMSAVASPIAVASGAYLPPAITVKYFSPNTTGLFAVIECPVPVADKAAVLLELIVSGEDEEKHITVEDISGVAA
ncbi:hypothetical protein [Candidatus Accumulibacter vicinus]|uniref:Uncharacterized protein n=1 Tax=Candidatus Accumulibacter vicinus TaxID=2954382 RepID=A0A084XU91_9PROT|nr:hypothetical protein [Candidatus Accumulibacter vicinus]KFB66035.1 MAG: hypothetical protein CAPSK01_004878 [Candidatus Accumulibacter vicinus]